MNRIIINLPPDLLELVTDWQHEQRVPSRNAAIRQMLGVASTARKLGIVRKGELHFKATKEKAA